MDLEDDEEDLENVSEEERRAASALADMLDAGHAPPRGDEDDSVQELALRVRAVVRAPEPLDDSVRRAAVEQAVHAGVSGRRRGNVVALFAAAAALLIAVGVGAAVESGFMGASGASEPLRYGGPTSALFSAPFAEEQSSSERLDRIVRARSRDYFSALAQRTGR